MVTFVINGDNKKLKDAARLAQNFFKQLKIEDMPDYFTHTNLTRGQVYAEIIEAAVCLPDRFIIVETYRPKWYWSKAIGYTLPSKPNYIYVNANKLDSLQIEDYVGNFAHEFMHNIGFKHNGNNPNKFRNLESVPYAIGALAEAWARSINFESTKVAIVEDTQLELAGV